MNAEKLLLKYYQNTEALKFLLPHVKQVADKAVKITKKLISKGIKIDQNFVYESAILHDIGIIKTNAPQIGCYGQEPYIKHGILGAEILQKEGFPKHAIIAQNHIGVGITKQEIIKNNLPLPHKDFIPQTIEEKIVAYSDKFFSKSKNGEKSFEEIILELQTHGNKKVEIFKKRALELENIKI